MKILVDIKKLIERFEAEPDGVNFTTLDAFNDSNDKIRIDFLDGKFVVYDVHTNEEIDFRK